MCGRYQIDNDLVREVKSLFSLDNELDKICEIEAEARPSNLLPVLIMRSNQVEIELFQWGFPGFNNNLIINARVETISEKKIFKENLQYRRCVVLAKGFYEWDASKNKYYFTDENSNLLFMAGVYNQFDEKNCFVILTTEAKGTIEGIHHRMPLLFDEEAARRWLLDDRYIDCALEQHLISLNKESDYIQISLDL